MPLSTTFLIPKPWNVNFTSDTQSKSLRHKTISHLNKEHYKIIHIIEIFCVIKSDSPFAYSIYSKLGTWRQIIKVFVETWKVSVKTFMKSFIQNHQLNQDANCSKGKNNRKRLRLIYFWKCMSILSTGLDYSRYYVTLVYYW